jgi:hypothetical protein
LNVAGPAAAPDEPLTHRQGTAALGALFVARLTSGIGMALGNGAGSTTLQSVAKLPASLRSEYPRAFADAMDAVFLAAAVVAFFGFVLSWLLPEKPLRGAVAARSADVGTEVGEAMAIPHTEGARRRVASRGERTALSKVLTPGRPPQLCAYCRKESEKVNAARNRRRRLARGQCSLF